MVNVAEALPGRVPGGLDVEVSYAWPEAALRVRGEIDLVTAPDLEALLDAVIKRGYRSVVLDVAQLDFMGASGLQCIADAAARLELLPGELIIRSPSALLLRTLVATGLDGVVQLRETQPSTAPDSAEATGPGFHLAAEEVTSAPRSAGSMHPGSVGPPPMGTLPLGTGMSRAFRTVASIPADDDVVDGALRLVVALARVTVGGADGVSVSLRRHGLLSTVAASDRTILDMDADQYGTGEGPCVDASVQGRWFHIESLDQETRWPAFTPMARKLGINAILSSPLMADGQPVGALNIYSRRAGSFDTRGQQLASVFAREASVILAQARVAVTPDELGERLAAALRSREVIAQAQGMLMERQGLTAEEAYGVLRRSSQKTSLALRDGAAAVLATCHRADGVPQVHPTSGGRDG